jgi:hypothetical protein
MFVMIAVVAVGLPIARAYAKRLERGTSGAALPSGEVLARLERIEQAIEAMATEVERIAEGQRFTTKLLAADVRSGEHTRLPASSQAPPPDSPRA